MDAVVAPIYRIPPRGHPHAAPRHSPSWSVVVDLIPPFLPCFSTTHYSYWSQLMPVNAEDEKDIYGGNYPKSRRLAINRSGGKCQFCGMRRAKEGHHWAYPKSNYPSGEQVQAHHLTALCKPCHEFVTILRTWTGEEDADFNSLAGALENANNFYEKRRAFSSWFFPEGQSPEEIISEEETSKEESLEVEVSENPSIQNSGNPSFRIDGEEDFFGEEGYVPPRRTDPRPDSRSTIRVESSKQSTRWSSERLLVAVIVIGASIAVLYTVLFVQ